MKFRAGGVTEGFRNDKTKQLTDMRCIRLRPLQLSHTRSLIVPLAPYGSEACRSHAQR